ncbi:response regulator, partial [Bacteriovoracaceae bacterium]|nr:response regulator [Bacteriovoracaceae bacterium]
LIREILVEELEYLGFEVIEAGSGNEAIELVQKNSFDLVVTDYHMENGSGLDLVESLNGQSLETKPPILLISGFIDISEETLREKGVGYFMKKPFEIDDFSQEVKGILKAA